jgi:hypothetical protein
MSTKQLQLFFFLQLQSGIQLTEQQLFHISRIRDKTNAIENTKLWLLKIPPGQGYLKANSVVC